MIAAQSAHQTWQKQASHGGADDEADLATFRLSNQADLPLQAVGVPQQVAGPGKDDLAIAGRLLPALAPIKQRQPVFRFQRLDTAGERRLGEVKFLAGPGAAVGFGEYQGVGELAQIQGFHWSIHAYFSWM